MEGHEPELTKLPCRACGRYTPHRFVDIPPFIGSDGSSDPGRIDRTCERCGTMYLPPEE